MSEDNSQERQQAPDDTFRVGKGWGPGGEAELHETDKDNLEQTSKFEEANLADFVKRDATGQPEVKAQGPEITKGQDLRRSDVDLLKELRQTLTDHKGIDASNMYVDLERGVVTLRGAAANPEEKLLAEEVARQTPGVKEVNNELQIHPNKPLHTGGPAVQGRPE